MNLDVNKDECSTEHLQQVTLDTRALQELITRAGGTDQRTNMTSLLSDAHFVGASFTGWLSHSPFPWPLSYTFPCSLPTLYLWNLLSHETGLFSKQALCPAHQSLKVAFSALPFSTLKHSEMTFLRFFQNLLDSSQPFPLALRVAASCCFFIIKCFVANLASAALHLSGTQTFCPLLQVNIVRSPTAVRVQM